MSETRTRWATPLFAVLSVLALAMILYAGRNLTFYFDEWNFILTRRGFTVDTLLAGHNGHLSLIPVLVYKALLQVVGIDHYWIYRLALGLLHVTTAWLLFTLARRRIGDAAGLAAGVLLLALGAAWDDLVWPFQIGFVGAVAASLAALLALERDTRRGDLLATVWLIVALCCSSPAIPFVIVAGVELAAGRHWRRLVRVLAPVVVLYGIWRIGWGSGGPFPAPDIGRANARQAPEFAEYALQMLQAALQGLTGFTASGLGAPLSVAAVAAVIAAVVLRPVSPRTLGVLVGVAAFWVLIAASRLTLGEPQSTRYIYPSAVLIVLLGIELVSAVRPAGARPSPKALVTGAIVLAVIWVAGSATMTRGVNTWEPHHRGIEIGLAAMTIAREHVPPGFQPAPSGSPQITAAAYFEAVDDFGTRVLSPAEIAASPEVDRAGADATLRSLEFAGVAAARGRARDCSPVAGDISIPGSSGQIVLRIPSGQSGQLRLKRFADEYPKDAVAQIPSGLFVVTVKRDSVGRPWIAGVTGAPGAARCAG
ncbi:MAG: hypothetical protein V9E83_12930 [Baekduia sp.]